jgi:PLD-like domain
MSPATVAAGGTDPRKVEKLIRCGVQVFTRRYLHAKTIVADGIVITGSANVSKRSLQRLDEAAILTNDRSAVRRAREFIERLAIEPVRPDYLEKCKQLYKPPRPNDSRVAGKTPQQRATHAKLWIVNLRNYSFPESEVERYEQGQARAEKLLRKEVPSNSVSFHWPHKPSMANELELGDWIIQVFTDKDGAITVDPPGSFSSWTATCAIPSRLRSDMYSTSKFRSVGKRRVGRSFAVRRRRFSSLASSRCRARSQYERCRWLIVFWPCGHRAAGSLDGEREGRSH